MSARHPHWEQRLSDCIAANEKRPYAYGRHDCLLWPAAAVEAVTGVDHGKGHRGKYRSPATASRHLQRMGFASPEDLLDSLFEEKPIGFAMRGDLVLASDGIPALCIGDFALSVGEGDAGLVRVPRAQWVKAWGVGEHHSGELPTPRRRSK